MIKIFFFVSGAWNPFGGPSTGRTWSKAPRVNRTGASPPTWTLSKLTWDTDVRKHKTCWGPMRCCSPSPTFQGGKSTNFYIHIKYILYNILFIYLFKNIVRLSQVLWATQRSFTTSNYLTIINFFKILPRPAAGIRTHYLRSSAWVLWTLWLTSTDVGLGKN